MTDKTQIQLVKKLSKLTNEQRLSWEKVVSRGVSQFQVSIGEATVRIRMKESGPHDPDYIISVLDSTGVTVETFSDVDVRDEENFPDAFKLMEEIYKKAGRIALGTDRILNNLLSDLDQF